MYVLTVCRKTAYRGYNDTHAGMVATLKKRMGFVFGDIVECWDVIFPTCAWYFPGKGSTHTHALTHTHTHTHD